MLQSFDRNLELEAGLTKVLSNDMAVRAFVYRKDFDLKPMQSGFPEAIQNASSDRRFEFAAGRYCVGDALQALGVEWAMDQPLWPEGTVGSLSHKQDLVVAVAGKTEALVELGIDCERMWQKDREKRLASRVLTAKEQQMLPSEDHGFVAKVFSAKESLLKALSPLGFKGSFQEVSVSFDNTDKTVRYQLHRESDLKKLQEMGLELPQGFCEVVDETILTLCLVKRKVNRYA